MKTLFIFACCGALAAHGADTFLGSVSAINWTGAAPDWRASFDGGLAVAGGAVVAWGNENCSDAQQVAAGGCHAIALKDDGTIVTWGYADYHNSGTVPEGLDGTATAIICGSTWVGALDADGKVWVWGSGYPDISEATELESGVDAIAAGGTHLVALKDGAVTAYGNNDAGQATVPAGLDTGVTAIGATLSTSYALKAGAITAWGSSESSTLIPIPTAAESGVIGLPNSSGYGHAMFSQKNHENRGHHFSGLDYHARRGPDLPCHFRPARRHGL